MKMLTFFMWIHDQCLTEFQINCPKTRLVFKRLIFNISFISQQICVYVYTNIHIKQKMTKDYAIWFQLFGLYNCTVTDFLFQIAATKYTI